MRSIGRVGRNVRSSAGGGEAAPSSRSDQVEAREWMVDLLHRAACCEVTQVDRREPRVLEESDHLLLRVRVITGEEDHAPPTDLVWVRGERVGSERVRGLDDRRRSHEVGDDLARRFSPGDRRRPSRWSRR